MITTNSFLDLLDGQSMLLAILVVGLSVLVIDYVRILVLRRKMVGLIQTAFSLTSKANTG